MATLDSVMTKLRNLLASLNTKTGRSDTTYNAAINALPSKKTSDNVTVSGATVTTPAGIFFSQVQKSVATAQRANTTLTTQNSDNTLVITASNDQGTGYVTGSNSTATTTVSMGVNGARVTATNGASTIVGYVKTATQATPSISVSSDGLITASATQTEGYVSAGTNSKTKQLTTQAAKTVTPTTSNQTAVAKGRYTTGAVTVKGDANLIPENIKSGVSIFGVTGAYEGSGGSSIGTCTVVLDMSSIGAYGNTQHTEVFYTQLQDGIWTNYEIIDSSVETYTLTDVVCGSGLTIRIKIGSYSNESNGIMSNSGNDLFFVTVSAPDGGTQTIYFEADD